MCAAAPNTGLGRRARSSRAHWRRPWNRPRKYDRSRAARHESRSRHDRLRGQRRRRLGQRAAGQKAVLGAPRRARPDRHQGRLRRRRLRRLHRPARRRSGLRLPGSGGRRCRPRGAHRRRPRQRQIVCAAGLLPRAWRRAMRHLHAGFPGGGHGAARAKRRAVRAGGPRCAGRCALPLHRLPQDHRGRAARLAPCRVARPAHAGQRPRRRRVADQARRRAQGHRRRKLRRRRLSGGCTVRACRALAASSRVIRDRRHRRLRRKP